MQQSSRCPGPICINGDETAVDEVAVDEVAVPVDESTVDEVVVAVVVSFLFMVCLRQL